MVHVSCFNWVQQKPFGAFLKLYVDPVYQNIIGNDQMLAHLGFWVQLTCVVNFHV
jgi:hypothetical protein